MSEYVDDCPDHDYYPPPGSDVSCPSCACADLRAKLQAAEEALFTANRDRQGWEDEAKLFLGQRDALQAEVARLTSEVREWLCDSCNTIYPGPPQKGVWCVVCPKCGGDTAPTKTIELRKARTRIAELEAENNNLIVKVQFAESVIRDEKQIERTATEAALRWAWKDSHMAHTMAPWLHDLKRDKYITRGLAALLNETNNQGETK